MQTKHNETKSSLWSDQFQSHFFKQLASTLLIIRLVEHTKKEKMDHSPPDGYKDKTEIVFNGLIF